MTTRSSKQDTDGVTWLTAAVQLGEYGLDLRRPDDPRVLSGLLNARFKDERTVKRRTGHKGQLIQDYGMFPVDFERTDEWVYGHGTKVTVAASDSEEEHYPISLKGQGVFGFNDTDVVWTGDRVLVVQDDKRFLGASDYWTHGASVQPWGIPAYLPQMKDTPSPEAFYRNSQSCAVTASLQFMAAATSEGVLIIMQDRATGVILDRTVIPAAGTVSQVRAVNSGGVPMLFWLDTDGTTAFQFSYWDGNSWTEPGLINVDAQAFDVCAISGGCQVIWRVDDQLVTGRFSGGHVTNAPHAFGTELLSNPAPAGAVTVAVSPEDDIAWAWVDGSDEVYCASNDSTLLQFDGSNWDIDYMNPAVDIGEAIAVTLSYRTLKNQYGFYDIVAHTYTGNRVNIYQLWQDNLGLVQNHSAIGIKWQDVCYNTDLMSKSFVVGNEVFAWLSARNSDTAFLRAGVVGGQVCGMADREQALMPDNFLQYNVEADPLSPYRFVWMRPYNDGKFFTRGHSLIGALDFMPNMSTTNYGRSTYVAGSLVRCWDGQELGDAGFHDYAQLVLTDAGTTGTDLVAGSYAVRVYPVRYNKQGERFQGVAIGSAVVSVAAGSAMHVAVKTTAMTNHDISWEVYSNYAGGTVFRYVGSIANDKTTATVTGDFSPSADDWNDSPGDPHTPNTDGVQELEESGPYGCAILTTAGDRMWQIGGQIPAGQAYYSKLYEANEGVGFDAQAGYLIVDATAQDLTSITPFSDALVVAFEKDRLFVCTGQGPNNYGVGSFGAPELQLVDGCIDHRGTKVLPIGVAYWSATGPKLLNTSFAPQNISNGVAPGTVLDTPSGVHVDLSQNEVVWYTEGGNAWLMNYTGAARWAQWNRLKVVSASDRRMMTPDGRLLTPDSSTPRDAGSRFEFSFASGNIRAEDLLEGGTVVRKVGVTGKFLAEHKPVFKLYYDGSPMWFERVTWEPSANTYLHPVTDYDAMTLEEIDALNVLDQSGAYDVSWRPTKLDCHFMKVSMTDGGDEGFEPWELDFEVGVKPGLGRSLVNKMTRG